MKSVKIIYCFSVCLIIVKNMYWQLQTEIFKIFFPDKGCDEVWVSIEMFAFLNRKKIWMFPFFSKGRQLGTAQTKFNLLCITMRTRYCYEYSVYIWCDTDLEYVWHCNTIWFVNKQRSCMRSIGLPFCYVDKVEKFQMCNDRSNFKKTYFGL